MHQSVISFAARIIIIIIIITSIIIISFYFFNGTVLVLFAFTGWGGVSN